MQKSYEMKLEMVTEQNKSLIEVYGSFSIGDETENYLLEVSDFKRDVSSLGLTGHFVLGDGASFSTGDRDNDNDTTKNCADEAKSPGWWGDT